MIPQLEMILVEKVAEVMKQQEVKNKHSGARTEKSKRSRNSQLSKSKTHSRQHSQQRSSLQLSRSLSPTCSPHKTQSLSLLSTHLSIDSQHSQHSQHSEALDESPAQQHSPMQPTQDRLKGQEEEKVQIEMELIGDEDNITF